MGGTFLCSVIDNLSASLTVHCCSVSNAVLSKAQRKNKLSQARLRLVDIPIGKACVAIRDVFYRARLSRSDPESLQTCVNF